MGEVHSQFRGAAQVTLVGTGLLGGSIGLGLRRSGYAGRIVGVGRRQQTLDRAVDMGCLDAGTVDLGEAMSRPGGRNLVILATPISAFGGYLEHVAALQSDEADPDVVVTDIGSTKQQVCDLAQRWLPDPRLFVGAHPMAGSERHGPDAARPDLFDGKPCIVTPTPDADEPAVALVESLWRALGMTLVRMTPAEHDRQVALISHLPHAAAVLLVELASREEALAIASTGFRDTTRVASGDPRVWTDIFMSNRSATMAAIDALIGELNRFKQSLLNNDETGVHERMASVKATRDRWLERVGQMLAETEERESE